MISSSDNKKCSKPDFAIATDSGINECSRLDYGITDSDWKHSNSDINCNNGRWVLINVTMETRTVEDRGSERTVVQSAAFVHSHISSFVDQVARKYCKRVKMKRVAKLQQKKKTAKPKVSPKASFALLPAGFRKLCELDLSVFADIDVVSAVSPKLSFSSFAYSFVMVFSSCCHSWSCSKRALCSNLADVRICRSTKC